MPTAVNAVPTAARDGQIIHRQGENGFTPFLLPLSGEGLLGMGMSMSNSELGSRGRAYNTKGGFLVWGLVKCMVDK